MKFASRRDATTKVGRDKRSVPGDTECRQRHCMAYAGLPSLRFLSQRSKGRKACGFTLIELMIVVVIAAILAAIAYPLYTHYVGKSRRSAAVTALQHAAALEEKYYALHNTYGSLADIGYGTGVTRVPIPSADEDWYTLAASAASASGYVLTATPVTAGPQNDDGCGIYTLKSDGERSVSGRKSTTECWGSG